MNISTLARAALILAVSSPVIAESVDLSMMSKIREEGMRNSQAVDMLRDLTDNVGGRLTGSPAMDNAVDWSMSQMKSIALTNIEKDPFFFGRGWTSESTTLVTTQPTTKQLMAVSEVWHPGTNGEQTGQLAIIQINSPADFERYKGKLNGKVVIVKQANRRAPRFSSSKEPERKSYRFSSDELTVMEKYDWRLNHLPAGTKAQRRQQLKGFFKRTLSGLALSKFLKEEGVIAQLSATAHRQEEFVNHERDYLPGFSPQHAKILVTQGDFNRLERLASSGKNVEIKVNVKNKFHDKNHQQFNVLGEIKGTSKKSEIVLAGAHLDSMSLGDGAADNGAGVVIMLEAMRILKALNVKPKRTIRIALWGAEEQGMIGTKNYVQENLAEFPVFSGDDIKHIPYTERFDTMVKPKFKHMHDKLSVYFNLDNGAGKIRGIFAENNLPAAEIFKHWFKPFNDAGASTIATRETGGTDHRPFQSAGIPGYQFIQDPLTYFDTTQHTTKDTFHMIEERDLKHSSIIMAAFLYNAAMRDEMMPRKPWLTY